MRSFLPLILAVMAAIALPRPALADDSDEPPKDRLEGRFGTGFISGSTPHMTIRRADIGVGIMYFPGGLPIALGTGVHFGPSFMEMNGPLVEGYGMDASLADWTNLSLEARAEITMYKDRILSFDLYGSLEMSAFDGSMEFTEAKLSTAQGSFDITPFLNKHLELRYGWNRMDAGVVAKVRIGPFVPRLGLGFQRMLLRLTAETDDEGKFVLANLGDQTGSIERLYEEDFTMTRLAPGVDWRIGRTFTLALDSFIMPTSETIFWGGSLATHITF